MPIDTKHSQYELFAPLWEKCRTAIEGEDAVKAKGIKYLPMVQGQALFVIKYFAGAS